MKFTEDGSAGCAYSGRPAWDGLDPIIVGDAGGLPEKPMTRDDWIDAALVIGFLLIGVAVASLVVWKTR